MHFVSDALLHFVVWGLLATLCGTVIGLFWYLISLMLGEER
jgi:hypothetical protein